VNKNDFTEIKQIMIQVKKTISLIWWWHFSV